MPQKSWAIFLESGAWIEIYRDTVAGRTVSFRVVMLADIGDTRYRVTRYDTAHGYEHRDVIGMKEGVRGKILCPTFPYNQAFQYAIRDIEENAETYLADFLAD